MTTAQSTPIEEIRRAVYALGDTPEEVAANLIVEGIYKGIPNSQCRCPIAEYLHKKFPTLDFSVLGEYVRYFFGFEEPVKVDLPAAVQEFIRVFDFYYTDYAHERFCAVANVPYFKRYRISDI